jgi:Golgi apyrase
VILDAGSSGTRVHIYRWLDSAKALLNATPKELQSLPKLMTKKKWTKKIRPGISTFGETPSAVGEEYLKDLLDHARSIVPEDNVADTPIFLMATAGVRLLPEIQRKTLLSEICRYAQSTSFSVPDCNVHIQAIPGETEGLYGWIAANYLLGGFDSPENHQHGKNHHTYGFLDMGGASAQIAFAPNQTESEKHANDLKLLRMRTVNGESSEYKVFVATWLGFGVNQARTRYVEALEESVGTAPGARELPDPCLPAGLTLTTEGKVIDPATAAAGSQPYLVGQGLFDECMKRTYPLLNKDAPCEDEPCLLNGQHVPAIDFDVNHFVGVSEYWHTTHEVFEMSHKDKAYDFNTYQQQVNEFCGQSWADIQKGVHANTWGKKVDEKTAIEVCFKASWLINVLHQGIGIPRVGLEKTPNGYNGTKDVLEHAKEKGYLDPFQAVDKIDDMEVSWTLGKMVLYAAGQIKPRGEALAVGFGSNSPSGIPDDFQYAGSNWTYRPHSGGNMGDDEDDDTDLADMADDLMEKVPKKSTSSLILLLLVLFFLGYIFRRKDRRKKLYKKFGNIFGNGRRPGSPRKGGRGFFATNKFFGRNSGHYERVLEDGEAGTGFELHEMDSDDNEHSDSSESSRVARSTGMATPKLNLNFSDSHYFENAPTHGLGAGLGLSGLGKPSAMDRSGLVVRTESRERLGPTLQMLGAGRRSRTGSPTRGKSPLMLPLAED